MPGLQSIIRIGALIGTALLVVGTGLSSAFATKHQPANRLFSSRDVPADLNASAVGFYTWTWIETLSAEVGSSQISTLGRARSERATAMRWRCPPEN